MLASRGIDLLPLLFTNVIFNKLGWRRVPVIIHFTAIHQGMHAFVISTLQQVVMMCICSLYHRGARPAVKQFRSFSSRKLIWSSRK